jgi:hypothetical protein
MAYRSYVSELVGTIPKLPYPLAQKLVNRAWKDIRDARLWSFLVQTGDIETAAIITTGSVSVTQGSPVIQLDADSSTALQAVAILPPPLPPLASPDLGVGRQIRIGVTGSGGPLYTIIAADFGSSPATLTVDRPYAAVTGTNQPYMVYKAYYTPPFDDFLRYFSVTNMNAGYTIRGKKLYYTQAKLNAIDPQRGGTGDAYIISAYKPGTGGIPVHEWYPQPVNAATYNCVCQRRGTDLSDSVDLPSTFPDSVLMARAFMHAADWALANVATYPELAQTNWPIFKAGKQSLYKDELILAIKQDDEISPLVPFLQGSYFDFPLGGQFLQGHDVSSLIGDLT